MNSLTTSNTRESFIVRNNILSEHDRGSMVAKRLLWLLGKTDLSEVRQILDVGSRDIGQSIELATIFPHARIDAFEPVPDSYNMCVQRHAILPDQLRKRIYVRHIALSDAAGQIPFYPVDAVASSVPNVGASSMFRFKDGLNGTPFGQHLVQREIMVQADTLDNWCARQGVTDIDIMWVDVQGAELLVFKGGLHMLNHTKVIMTEVGLKPYYEGHTLKADIDALLANHGFYELKNAFELNGFDYEANTIYIRQ